jgi:cardiolipin synthase
MTAEYLFVLFFTLLDLLCIFAVIFVERKNPASTIAWTLVLIFVPFVGFAGYLMFGSGFHVNKKKRYELKRIADTLYKQIISRFIEADGGRPSPDAVPYQRVVRYLSNDGGHYLSQDNAARVFTDGKAMFESMLADMRGAKRHIHLLYYIIRNDSLGQAIVRLLAEKAAAGVEVRLIYDSLGSILTAGRMFRPLIEAGGSVEAFSPILFSISSHLRLNYRNHRKITVVDGETGYVGGMNIGTEYMGMSKRLHPWRDTHLRLTGTAVSFLQERFLLDWLSVRRGPIEGGDAGRYMAQPVREGALAMQIASSGPDSKSETIKNALLEMLYLARERVYIQSPYVAPDDSCMDALAIAARSGVDVRIMIPGIGDHWFVQASTYSYAWQLLDAGVKIYRYNGFLHAKTMVVDGTAASIGSANLGARSFSLNFEVNAFIYDAGFASDYERIFLEDLANCTQLDSAWFRRRSAATRFAYSVCRLFSPLM